MESESVFRSVISEMRDAFGTAPRQFDFWGRRYVRLKIPLWVKLHDDTRFAQLYQDQELLFTEGTVVWGHIVQANEALFTKGRTDMPAAIIYSLNPAIDGRPDILEQAAHDLFAVKGEETDADLQEFSAKLADEHVADLRLPVPTRLSEGVECFYTTTMIVRKHIPDKRLAASLFPFLVCPEKTEAGTILPARYWPESFIERFWLASPA